MVKLELFPVHSFCLSRPALQSGGGRGNCHDTGYRDRLLRRSTNRNGRGNLERKRGILAEYTLPQSSLLKSMKSRNLRIDSPRSASYGGQPSHAPFHSAYFCCAKKSTDSKPYGLPSVALAKDGGTDNRSSNRVREHSFIPHPLKVPLQF